MPEEPLVLVEREGRIALLTLNRPKALNALNGALLNELAEALEALDRDDEVRCSVLTGNERAFAAGGDIKQMSDSTVGDMVERESPSPWRRIAAIRKPVIAAVGGYALGGGCELALTCDMIVASEAARFGQPEIDLGIIPGAGGTQRLTRAVGKARAMELVLTGRRIEAREAYTMGMITRVSPAETYLDDAKELARAVAAKAPLAAQLGKDAVNKAYETMLDQGLDYERKSFLVLFSTEDKEEGMAAFTEKRKPEFRGR
ncbi:enoyl-CoA hydratase-related protein [Rubrobacter indicoceani]|uniref:enoyl-CoA hydratase-related protein n=1 Tax=Rubrobacter indicoceani TaxID=2051957 RepID=UPI000E5AEABD|nr:enoyl-CoA hydratase-related protein [Rubrobacter indicoceani]